MKKIKRFFRRLKNKFVKAAKIPYKLKIETLRGWTWCDKDRLLLDASFQILINFIEEEKPEESNDWDYTDEHRKAWAIINNLYYWFIDRANRHDPIDEVEHPEVKFLKIENKDLYELKWIHKSDEAEKTWKEALKNSMDLEQKWYEEDTEALCELAKIRKFLWT